MGVRVQPTNLVEKRQAVGGHGDPHPLTDRKSLGPEFTSYGRCQHSYSGGGSCINFSSYGVLEKGASKPTGIYCTVHVVSHVPVGGRYKDLV